MSHEVGTAAAVDGEDSEKLNIQIDGTERAEAGTEGASAATRQAIAPCLAAAGGMTLRRSGQHIPGTRAHTVQRKVDQIMSKARPY